MELVQNSKSSNGEKEANHALPSNPTVRFIVRFFNFIDYRNARYRNLSRFFNKLSISISAQLIFRTAL